MTVEEFENLQDEYNGWQFDSSYDQYLQEYQSKLDPCFDCTGCNSCLDVAPY